MDFGSFFNHFSSLTKSWTNCRRVSTDPCTPTQQTHTAFSNTNTHKYNFIITKFLSFIRRTTTVVNHKSYIILVIRIKPPFPMIIHDDEFKRHVSIAAFKNSTRTPIRTIIECQDRPTLCRHNAATYIGDHIVRLNPIWTATIQIAIIPDKSGVHSGLFS